MTDHTPTDDELAAAQQLQLSLAVLALPALAAAIRRAGGA